MQQRYQCPNCGQPIVYGIKYCGTCGTQLDWSNQQQSQSTPQYQQQTPYYQQQQYNRTQTLERHQHLIPYSISDNLPAMVKNQLASLSAERQSEFLEEYNRRKKSTAVAYILWLLLGWHYAYISKWGVQFLFWITIGGLGIWWLIDIFRIPGLTKNYNNDIAVNVMRDTTAIGGY